MKQITKISEGDNFSAISIGNLNNLNEYSLIAAPGVEISGKVFAGQSLHATGGEISFQVFAPGQETGFIHTHKTHEEMYIFIKGEGEFQVDGRVISVNEGSVVRVAPNGKRSIRNNGTESLIMICVQYRGNTFTSDDAQDGVILKEEVKW